MNSTVLSSSILGKLFVRGALLLSLAGASVAITDAAFAGERESSVATPAQKSSTAQLPRDWTWTKNAVSFDSMYRK